MMRAFGIDPAALNELSVIFEKHLHDLPDAKVWLFGSRAKGNYKNNSDIDLAISSRSKKVKDRLPHLRLDLQDSNVPYLVDLIYWPELAESFVKEVKKTRIPFWDSKMIEKRSPWRICPIGQYWVSRHDRPYPSGISDVDGHCRSFRHGKDVLLFDEIKQIESTKIFQSAPRPSVFKNNTKWGEDFDGKIAGWVAYWNDLLGLRDDPIDPNVIKALVASESSFDPLATPKGVPKSRQARGLIQIMPETRRILGNPTGELKDHLLLIKPDELFDPSISISAGIRWLARKKEIASRKLKRKATWKEAVLEYKGILMQDPKRGKNPEIRNKLNVLYESLGI